MGDGTGADTGAQFTSLMKRMRGNLPATALILAEKTIDLAAFGQAFIANPDLVARLRNGWPLNEADRLTFYGGGAQVYIDYPAYRGKTD